MKQKNTLLIILFCVQQVTAFAQSLNDTLHLQEVEISTSLFDKKDHTFNAGKKVQETDSVIKQIFDLNDLANILNYQTSVFVKNYAPGSIASTSVRGGNAQQTMVLWNGVNINHPMLGQADLSQIATGLFDNISIEYGAASSLWGSPAMNGSVRLENIFSDKKYFQLKYKYGSFNTHQGLFNSQWAFKKMQFNIRTYANVSENNYKIGDSIQLKNNSFANYGSIGSVKYSINQHWQLQLHAWYNIYQRNIPNNYFFNQYSSRQEDKNFRNVLDIIYTKNKIKAGIKAAYLLDELNYNDSLARIHSFSKVHTFQSEENIYQKIFSGRAEWMAGHQWVYNYAITNNYLDNAVISRHSAFGGIKWKIKVVEMNVLVRKEWANIRSDIPLTGNLGLNYHVHKNITLKVRASKNYRLPTMNDLYWKGSGNVNLQPESGYEYEGGMAFHFNIPALHSEFFSELTAFNRYTNNWIIWLPGGNGNPVPANIAKVWSRGTETNNYWIVTYDKFKIKTAVSSAYVLSTTEKSEINNDASLGRQLIYTPRYNINGYVQLFYKKWFVIFSHQYVGYRFISSDNLQWLEPYNVFNCNFGKSIHFKKYNIEIFTGINNLFNTSYMIISQRPMPARNYFIQMNLKWEK